MADASTLLITRRDLLKGGAALSLLSPGDAGIGAAQDGRHRDDRHVDVRELVDADLRVGVQAEDHHREDQHRGEDRASD